jgi:hypothetical protein
MLLVLPLTPEQESRLRQEAEKNGQNLTDYALSRLLGDCPQAEPTGAQILKQLEADGVLGTFADRPDSPEWARQLREAAERRVG